MVDVLTASSTLTFATVGRDRGDAAFRWNGSTAMRVPIQPDAAGGDGGGAEAAHATTDKVVLSNKWTLPVWALSEGVQ
jgi:hypothetical protein